MARFMSHGADVAVNTGLELSLCLRCFPLSASNVSNGVFTRSSKRPAFTCILNTFAGSLLQVCWIV